MELPLPDGAAIVVQRPTINGIQDAPVALRHAGEEPPRPVQVASIRAGGNKRERHAKPGNPGGEPSEFRGVFFRGEIPPAAPGLVAHAPKPHLEGFRVALAGTLIRERGSSRRRIAILDPFIEVPGGVAAEVGRQVRLRADEPAEMHEFVGAELVGLVLGRAVRRAGEKAVVDPEIGAARALRARPDAVAPVVAIGKTPAGPAHDGRLEPPHVLHEFASDAALVADLGILPHPDAVIDDAADVLREVAVKIGRDDADRFIEQHFNRRGGICRACDPRPAREDCCACSQGLEEVASVD